MEDKGKYREIVAFQFAKSRVKECVANPRLIDDPVTTISALLEYIDLPAHQCYWNDRFCIAVMCGLDDRQRFAAWCAVSNGVNGYFEWETHYGYKMVKTLRHIGVIDDDFIPPDNSIAYCWLSPDIAKAIIQKFNLPTTWGGCKKELTQKEEAERKLFNFRYPFIKVL